MTYVELRANNYDAADSSTYKILYVTGTIDKNLVRRLVPMPIPFKSYLDGVLEDKNIPLMVIVDTGSVGITITLNECIISGNTAGAQEESLEQFIITSATPFSTGNFTLYWEEEDNTQRSYKGSVSKYSARKTTGQLNIWEYNLEFLCGLITEEEEV